MPSQETAFLFQTAVLWPRIGYDPYGRPIVGAPIELSPPCCGVRWDGTRREVMDKDGNTVALDFEVIVSRDILIGSRMWQGSLDSWNVGSSVLDQELMEVKTFDKVPDIKARFNFRKCGLIRLHGVTPGNPNG